MLTLQRQLSFASDTNSTISDLPGAGRTLDAMLNKLGRHLELCLRTALARVGFGPMRPMRDVLRIIARADAARPSHCLQCKHEHVLRPIPKADDLGYILEWVYDVGQRVCRRCGALSPPITTLDGAEAHKRCRLLVKALRCELSATLLVKYSRILNIMLGAITRRLS
jgi:hypothetical protein